MKSNTLISDKITQLVFIIHCQLIQSHKKNFFSEFSSVDKIDTFIPENKSLECDLPTWESEYRFELHYGTWYC